MNLNLINKDDDCVLDYVKSFSYFNENVISVTNKPIILRKDVKALTDKVVILSGGGSGHEPAHSGFVGKGMLTGAVSGDIFTSPPPNVILEAIYQIGQGSKNGVLIIVKNYTGDRINFNIAAERARKLGISVEIVIVGEDTALESFNKTCGRRGLAGTVLIHKIAGAMAEKQYTLTKIKDFLSKILEFGIMGTLGISFTGSTLYTLDEASIKTNDQMYELGLGIHGEAGAKKEKFKNADLLMKQMVNHLTKTGFGHVNLVKGETIVIVLNNLGSCTQLELLTFANSLFNYLEYQYGVTVIRGYCGSYVTSLQMYGISITILKVIDKSIIEFLDDPVDAPGWYSFIYKSSIKNSVLSKEAFINSEYNFEIDSSFKNQEIILDDDFKYLEKAILSACDALISQESYLNDLDKDIGDFDCGSTFKRGAVAVKKFFVEWNSKKSEKYIIILLSNLSLIVESHMGGTSGGLLSLFFESLARQYKENPESLWCDLFLEATQVISAVGGAIEGDRTMLDVLFPVIKMWKNNYNDSMENVIPKLSIVAQKSSESTKKMMPLAGRASYVKQNDIFENIPDPGAEAINIIIQAITGV